MTKNPFMVTIYFRGDNLDPEMITKHLGVNPTKTRRKGEQRLGKQGRSYINKTGIWALEAIATSPELSDHIYEITSKITSLQDIRSITDIEDAFIDVFLCFERTEISDSYEFDLTEEAIAEIKQLGLPMQFTVSSVAGTHQNDD